MSDTLKKVGGRSSKQNLEYAYIKDSPKRAALARKFGLEGIGFYDQILIACISNYEGGYWVSWTEESLEKEMFLFNNKVNHNSYELMFTYCINQDIFNKRLFEQFQILTNEDVQVNWLTAAQKRLRFEEGIKEEFLLVDPTPFIEYNRKRFKTELQALANDANTGEENASISYTPVNSIEDFEDLVIISKENNSTPGYVEVLETVEIVENELQESKLNSDLCIKASLTHEKTTLIQRREGKQSEAKQSEALQEPVFSPTENSSKEVGFETPLKIENENSVISKIGIQTVISSFESEKEPITISKSNHILSNSENKPKKEKKTPHPARLQIVEIWEKHSGFKYIQDAKQNIAIVNIIKHLDAYNSNNSLGIEPENIVNTFEFMYINKHKLPQYFQDNYFIDFQTIANNFVKIMTKLKDAKSEQSENVVEQNPLYQKMIDTWNTNAVSKYKIGQRSYIKNIVEFIENQLNVRRISITDDVIIKSFSNIFNKKDLLNDYQRSRILSNLKSLSENIEEITSKIVSANKVQNQNIVVPVYQPLT